MSSTRWAPPSPRGRPARPRPGAGPRPPRRAAAIARGSPRRARPRVGAAPAPVAWPGAAAVIDAIGKSLAAGGVIVVAGPAASGARELVDGAVRRHQLAQVAGRAPAQAMG